MEIKTETEEHVLNLDIVKEECTIQEDLMPELLIESIPGSSQGVRPDILKCGGDPKFQCSECERSFSTKRATRIHTLKTHYGLSEFDISGKVLTCDECGKKFPTQSKLSKHKRNHSTIRQHQCTECQKCFKRGSQLTYHIASVHTTERAFTCNICGDAFKAKAALNRHFYRHQDENRIPCKICGKIVRRDCMRNHVMKIHHGLKFECAHCAKKYTTKVNIKRHIMKIHLKMSLYEITGKKISCPECKKEFCDKRTLKSHLISHNTAKNFKCPHCSKDFKGKKHLGEHLRRHEKSQNFSDLRKKISSTKVEEDSGNLEYEAKSKESLSVDPTKIKNEYPEDEEEPETHFKTTVQVPNDSRNELNSWIKIEYD
ncbi:oocyte zinc finger protein XlCOF26-like [Lutzomyia longipalpis]|uniref:oocyte zinc finger protein XlCOF26-like n=1 Tax=Lutzomyia longipalpis TaxID=7200 RepID=UPI002483E7DC|nr:oocyte zinc finger protein XlCOF26-like [Lutzomyia longipalpis]